MDVLAHLEHEHRKTEKLLEQLQDETEPAKRARIFDDLVSDLHTHMAVEERFLYPIVKEVFTRDDAHEATDEHRIIRELLGVAADRIHDGAFGDALDALTAGIAHHVEEEENELFPELREKAADRLAELDPEALETAVEEDPTRDQLYERAREQEVDGRSTMTKNELREAVD